MDSADQPQFDFSSDHHEEGYRTWLEQRQQAMRQLARQLGLPLERKVEVWLHGEIRLVGVLRLREEKLFIPEVSNPRLELVVDNVPFLPVEMVSCVALE